MKKLVRNIGKHKVIFCSILAVLLVGGIGVGAAFNLSQNNKNQLKAKAIESLNNGDNINSEEMKELATGEEIVKDNGETVVLTQDENGNVVETVVRDTQGNSTGATIPQNHNNNGVTPHSSDPQPAPPGHTHNWVAHYATRQIQTGTSPEQGHNEPIYTRKPVILCSGCNQEVGEEPHIHNGVMCGCYNSVINVQTGTKYVVDVPAQPIYSNEQYVDYYYCSECGARQ